MKKLKIVLGCVFVLGWIGIYMYHPLHNRPDKNAAEITLLYALHDLTELQSVNVKKLQKDERLGRNTRLLIGVEGDNLQEIFSRDALVKNGWTIVDSGSRSVMAERNDYRMAVFIDGVKGHLELSAK